MGNKYIEERKERLEQLERFKIVENDFVMIDPQMEIRPSRLIRQIEEGIYNIKKEDYNAYGDLKSPSEIGFKEGGNKIDFEIVEEEEEKEDDKQIFEQAK